jgi:hypothetical protein
LVLEQAPYADDGTPFPTTFWLSCEVLVRAIGRLEGDGGIERCERDLASDPALRADRALVERRVAALRAALAPGNLAGTVDGGASLRTGIGGSPVGGPLKCLHAHAAVALAAGPYALGERILELAAAPDQERCCAWA